MRSRSLTRVGGLVAGAALAATAVAAGPALAAGGGGGGGDEAPTIAEAVVAASSTEGFDDNRRDYDMLLTALGAADLVDAVADPQAELTVLAPDDAAFVALARSLGFAGDDEAGAWEFLVGALTELGGGDPIPVLTTVLLYHVVPDDVRFVEVVLGGELPTLAEGASLTSPRGTAISDADPDNDTIRLRPSASNLVVANGVIHTIDGVLLPLDLPGTAGDAPDTHAASLAELVVAASSTEGFDRDRRDYDMLLAALGAADLVDAVADSEAELTVFAPNDLAFIRLARTLGYRGHDEAGAWEFLVGALTELGEGDPIPVLTQVLLYHVVGGSLDLGEVFSAGQLTSLQGGTIGVAARKLIDADPDLLDPRLKLTDSNRKAVNGYLHTINRVLLPIDLP